MNESYDFFIAGRARNKEKILEISDIFDKYNTSYYCFFKNEDSNTKAGLNLSDTPEKLAKEYKSMDLNSFGIQTLFKNDLDGERKSKNFLLILPAGKSAHIEAGITYGLGKKCYAIGEYDVTDSLYLIFDKIFSNEHELVEFLKNKENA